MNRPCVHCVTKDIKLVHQDLIIRRLLATNKELTVSVVELRDSIDTFVLNTKVNEFTSIAQ